MKKYVVFFLLSLTGLISKAQINLVPNSGFDTVSTCPTGLSQINHATHWIDPTGASSDLLHSCSTNSASSTPANDPGSQIPYNGGGYSGLVTYAEGFIDHREYIQVQLNNPLIAGKLYKVSFQVSWGDAVKYATDGIGAYFSTTPISCSGCFLNYVPQVGNGVGNIISDGSQWAMICDTFLAQGGESYMTIGNFLHDSLTNILLVNNSSSLIVAYDYVDDVNVSDIGWSGISEFRESSFSLFPNPSTGEFRLQGNFPAKSELHIFDLVGNEIATPTLISEGEQTLSLNLKLSEGVYFYRIISGTAILAEDRLVIMK